MEQLVERGPGTAGLLRHAVRIFELTQDLRLAEHHGVETRGDAEGVFYGLLFLVNVQTGGEVEIIAMVPFEPPRQFRAGRGSRPVDLGAVTRGQNDHLCDSGFLPQSAQRGNQSVLAERHLFAQSDRCGRVIHAEDIECH